MVVPGVSEGVLPPDAEPVTAQEALHHLAKMVRESEEIEERGGGRKWSGERERESWRQRGEGNLCDTQSAICMTFILYNVCTFAGSHYTIIHRKL